jgi:predicted DNA-binding transcriptional regulator AlpA
MHITDATKTAVEPTIGERLVDKYEMLDRIGRSYAYLCDLMKQGKFPKPRDFHGRPAWLDSDLTAWMRGLPPRLVRGDPGAEEAYAKQHLNAKKGAASRHRMKLKERQQRRENSGKRR